MAAGLPTILDVNLVTPRGVVAHSKPDDPCRSVQAPGEVGEFELLPGHVPLLTALKAGVLTIGTKSRTRYAVSSGYLRVDPSGAVEILVEQAVAAADVDVEAAKKDLAAAEAELAKWGDKPQDGDYVSLVQRAGWARARIDVVAH
jgi:F-type H+-transporting ATPase subunit epsilon